MAVDATSFESYLLPKARCDELREAGTTRLAISGSAEDYLEASHRRISDLLAMLKRDIGTVEGLSVDKDGELHLTPLDKGVPEEAEQGQRDVQLPAARARLAECAATRMAARWPDAPHLASAL